MSKVMSVLILLAIVFCVAALAQVPTGTISGVVTDESGAVIPNASVAVVDTARGTNRALITDGAGQWAANSIIPGTYTVRASAMGFRTIERPGVIVEVGQTIRIDLVLQAGEQTQTITVTEEIPFMNTSDAQLGGTVTNAQINELPLNGRNFQRLLHGGERLVLFAGREIEPGDALFCADQNGLGSSHRTWSLAHLTALIPSRTARVSHLARGHWTDLAAACDGPAGTRPVAITSYTDGP